MAHGSKKRRRILHTADSHLVKLGDKPCQSLEAVIGLAIKTKVDLVIIAGDLFDYNNVDDDLVSFAIEQLKRLPVDVLILPGNHDCLVEGSVYCRDERWKHISNVRIFTAEEGETLDLPDLGISVWGKPIASYDGDLQPMVGIPRRQCNGHWHIAMAHGYYVGDKPPVFPSLHITQEEVVTSGWDYIALGHLPAFRCVCDEPVAYYCGSPSSISATVAIVDFDEETGVQVTRYSVAEEQAEKG